jgi:diguanylate cyclase (GGDEF)-like protein
MRKDVLEEILSCPSLPTLPAVAVRVIELTSDPNVRMSELGRVIETDQGLSTKILRTVNSSFYGLRTKCGNIQKALVMLGLGPVKSLALSFSLVKAIQADDQSDDEFGYMPYWRRGLFTAVAARVFGQHVRVEDPDEAFLGGLLQDVGMVAMYRALGTRYLDVLRGVQHHRELVTRELQVFEVQHPDIGSMLAERWKLPPALSMPVRYHERPTAAPGSCIPLIRCVALGNTVHDVLTDADPAEALRVYHARAEQWFGIDEAAADRMLERIGAGVRELSSLLRLSTGPSANVGEVLKRANDRLIELSRVTASLGADAVAPSTEAPATSERDPLTGLATLTAYEHALKRAMEQSEVENEAVSVVQVRLDASTLGKSSQDEVSEVLLGVAAILNKHFQPTGGVVARLGESAFGVVIVGTGRLATVRMAEEFRADLEATGRRWGAHGGVMVTASVGVVGVERGARSPFERPEQLTAATLRALQACEGSGGNCVRSFVPKAA